MIGRARAHMPNGMPMAWMATDNDQPVYIDHGHGTSFTDLDGYSYLDFNYLDFNASDMAMFCGHANPAIVAAVQAQAARSTQFLLPSQASVEVAEELARRYRVPQWQFTLLATQANTEAIRLARPPPGATLSCCSRGTTTAASRRAWWTWTAARSPRCSAGCPGASPAGYGSPSSTTPARSPALSGSGSPTAACGKRCRAPVPPPPDWPRTGTCPG